MQAAPLSQRDLRQYYWNFTNAGTIIERDFPQLREELGKTLVRTDEFEYRGERYVIQ